MLTQGTSRAAKLAQPTSEVTTASAVRTIPVVNGRDALCDEQDYAFLSRFSWWVKRGTSIDYVLTRIGSNVLYMHHLVLMSAEKRKVNHRDGDGFNNCRGNLRVASCGQVEAAKVKSTKRVYTSQYKGVCKPKGKTRWQASISVAGVDRKLGTFDNEEAAARAYDAAALEAFGEFAYQNFPSKQSQ